MFLNGEDAAFLEKSQMKRFDINVFSRLYCETYKKVTVISGSGEYVSQILDNIFSTRVFPHSFYNGMFTVCPLSEVVGVASEVTAPSVCKMWRTC